MGKIRLVVVILLFLLAGNLLASSWEKYGDLFLRNKEYYRAITMFHLAFFDSTTNSVRCRVLLKSAEAYIGAHRYESALKEYDRAWKFCKNHRKLLYLKGRDFFLKGDYSTAASLWANLSSPQNLLLVGIGKVLAMEGGWGEIEKYAQRVTGSEKRRVKLLLNFKNYHLKYRSPLLAAILSAVIPGAGQIYTAHYGEASLSFVVNAIFAFLTYQAVRKAEVIPHYGYSEAGFWGFLGMGFYLGNIYGAALSARQFNYYEKINFRKRFLSTVKAAGISLDFSF